MVHAIILAHGVEITGDDPEFVVHPPVGKWLIALGIKLFGDNEFGWRFMGALLGSCHDCFNRTHCTAFI